MNQIQEPMGPLMKATQKIVITAVTVLDVMLLLGAIRYIPVLYKDWLFWVSFIIVVLMLVLLVYLLPDLYRNPQKK